MLFQKLGNALGSQIKIQINIKMEKIDDVPQAAGLRDLYIPLIWLNDDYKEGINNPEVIKKVKDFL